MLGYNRSMDETIKQLLDRLMHIVGDQGASDLHLMEGRLPIVRYKRELIPLTTEQPLTREVMQAFLMEMIGEEKLQQLTKQRIEADFSYHYHDTLRLRGNSFLSSGKIGIALRAIPKVKTIEDLNLPAILKDFTKKEQGFFLVVGPTGHGKSTTLAAMIDLINSTSKKHIVTIENPVEFIFEDKMSIVDQRELDVDTNSFPRALRAAFREDIDVVLIGEMRDPDTISIAVTAAETGHLVFSTLHTNDAIQSIDRIVDSFPGAEQQQIRNQLAESLIGIFSIRLIPSQKGVLMPAYELLIANDAVANLIRENRTHEIVTVIETSRDAGMITLNGSLLELVRNGDITVEDAIHYSPDPLTLRRLL